MIVQQMEPAGIGNLQIAFDQLKNKLKLKACLTHKTKKTSLSPQKPSESSRLLAAQ